MLWEVANESSGDGTVTDEFAAFLGMDKAPSWGDSTDWQYWVIDTVKQHEAARGYHPHPIGMTMQFPVARQTKVNDPLLGSRAEWISPGYDDEIFANGGHPMAPGVSTRETAASDVLTVESDRTVEFSSSFPPGPAVLYLKS